MESLRIKEDPAATPRCPFCHADVAGAPALWTCPGCSTPHHADCARENGRCTVLGCGAPFERADPTESPAPLAASPRPRGRGALARFFAATATILTLGVPIAGAIAWYQHFPDDRDDREIPMVAPPHTVQMAEAWGRGKPSNIPTIVRLLRRVIRDRLLPTPATGLSRVLVCDDFNQAQLCYAPTRATWSDPLAFDQELRKALLAPDPELAEASAREAELLSWRNEAREQREALQRLVGTNPELRPALAELERAIAAYDAAPVHALRATTPQEVDAILAELASGKPRYR